MTKKVIIGTASVAFLYALSDCLIERYEQ